MFCCAFNKFSLKQIWPTSSNFYTLCLKFPPLKNSVTKIHPQASGESEYQISSTNLYILNYYCNF